MTNKKAQGLPLQTIILMIIVLVVLVVIIAVFLGKSNLFGEDIGKLNKDCVGEKEHNGQWKSECAENEKKVTGIVSDAYEHPNDICCIEESSSSSIARDINMPSDEEDTLA